jgi:hypothetical protein
MCDFINNPNDLKLIAMAMKFTVCKTLIYRRGKGYSIKKIIYQNTISQ